MREKSVKCLVFSLTPFRYEKFSFFILEEKNPNLDHYSSNCFFFRLLALWNLKYFKFSIFTNFLWYQVSSIKYQVAGLMYKFSSLEPRFFVEVPIFTNFWFFLCILVKIIYLIALFRQCVLLNPQIIIVVIIDLFSLIGTSYIKQYRKKTIEN